MNSKRCRDCGEAKPLEEFFVNPSASDGRHGYCKPCHGARNQANRQKRQERAQRKREELLEAFLASGVQSCRRCGVEKPFSDFHNSRDTVSGVRTICKTCATYSSHANRVRPPRIAPLERLQARVAKTEQGCWLWTGGTSMNWYLNGETMNARRAALILTGTPVEAGYQVKAGCKSALCIAPEHARVTPLGDGLRHDRKRCSRCKAEKPLSEFTKSVTGQKGRHGYCKKCKADLARERVRLDPRRRRKDILAKYGLTQEDFDSMYEAQGGACAICGGPGGVRGLVIDHDHDSGAVRQLLCSSCNAGIAMLQHDSAVIQSALEYVSRWNNRLGGLPRQASLVFGIDERLPA